MPYRMLMWALVACYFSFTPLFVRAEPNDAPRETAIFALEEMAGAVSRIGERTWIELGVAAEVGANPSTVTFTCPDRLQPGARVLLFTAGPDAERELVAEATLTVMSPDHRCVARVVRLEAGKTPLAGQIVALSPDPPIIGVLDFTRPHGESTLLGQQLAEKLASLLQRQAADGFQVLEPFRVRQVLANNRLNEADLFDPQRLTFAAKQPPLRLVVAGTVSLTGGEVRCSARLVDAVSGRQVNSLRVSCPLTPELAKLFESPPVIPAPEPVLMPDLIAALRQLVLFDRDVQNMLRGPAGPPGPIGRTGPVPPLPNNSPLSSEQAAQVIRLLETFGPTIAEIRGDLRALNEKLKNMEQAGNQ